MIRLVLALVTIALIGCARPAANQAVYHAGTITQVKPACMPLRTGAKDSPDTALCEAGGKILLYCWSGTGAGSDCAILGNFFPKKEQPAAPPPTAPAATPSSPPTDAKPADAPKPEVTAKADDKKPDAKPATDPPKKTEPKK